MNFSRKRDNTNKLVKYYMVVGQDNLDVPSQVKIIVNSINFCIKRTFVFHFLFQIHNKAHVLCLLYVNILSNATKNILCTTCNQNSIFPKT